MRILQLISFVFFLSNFAHADSIEILSKAVRDVCIAPDQAGKIFEVEAEGDIGVKIKFLKLGTELEGKINKSDWDGVQRVLKEHQSSEHKNYRDCVIKIMPTFIALLPDTGEPGGLGGGSPLIGGADSILSLEGEGIVEISVFDAKIRKNKLSVMFRLRNISDDQMQYLVHLEYLNQSKAFLPNVSELKAVEIDHESYGRLESYRGLQRMHTARYKPWFNLGVKGRTDIPFIFDGARPSEMVESIQVGIAIKANKWEKGKIMNFVFENIPVVNER